MSSLTGKEIGPTGFGLMRMYVLSSPTRLRSNKLTGMTWVANPPPQSQCFATMDTALIHGANFWNGGELYGTPDYNSLHLLHDYFTAHPEKAEKVVLSIKGGLIPGQLIPDGSEENINRSVEECVRVLGGKKKIDIFECARQDPKTTVEETVGTLKKFVEKGVIGGIGLSEVDADTIRRAYVFSVGKR